MNDKQQRFTYHFIFSSVVLLCAYILLYRALGQTLLSHSVYDSYTRQAAMWWQGRCDLPENVTWLELAFYNGRYYVSCPPFPSVAQFLLYPFFGLHTPDNLLNTLLGFGAFVLVYRYMMREGHGGFVSSCVALLMTLGSNLFYLSLTGWVWFSAQTQAFFFSVLAVYLAASPNKTAWYFAFLSLGFAFACRPLNLVYAPLLFYLMCERAGGPYTIRTLVRYARYALPLAGVGIAAAVYNAVRFGSPFEFGHNFLPEFLAAPQFSFAYVPGNFLEILKLPGTTNSFWPMFNGTLFFLVNPAYILLAVRLVQKRLDGVRIVYLISLLLHVVFTLAHKTMGGWQFGCRYLVDMLPFMLVIIGERQKASAPWRGLLPFALAALGIAVNIWGALWYYTSV